MSLVTTTEESLLSKPRSFSLTACSDSLNERRAKVMTKGGVEIHYARKRGEEGRREVCFSDGLIHNVSGEGEAH